jgi:hypothetical protein
MPLDADTEPLEIAVKLPPPGLNVSPGIVLGGFVA